MYEKEEDDMPIDISKTMPRNHTKKLSTQNVLNNKKISV